MARLDPAAIVDEAVALADADGAQALSLRRLADRFAVTPMALYRHVGGKEELLDAVADRLYGELDLPRADGDWWGELARLARSARRVLLTHPWAAPLFARPLAGPNGRALDAAMRSAFVRAGFSEADARELHDQLSNMVFGLVAPEIHGKRNRAAFERGLDLLHAGVEARLAGD